LIDSAMTAVAHCAPPGNKPLPLEIDNCSDYLDRTAKEMPNLRVVVALGRIAFEGCLRLYRSRGWLARGPKPQFGHGAEYRFDGAPFLLCCFHPSQQNTFTGKLTPAMIREVFARARGMI
jgi:uracil-DNA glycosylase